MGSDDFLKRYKNIDVPNSKDKEEEETPPEIAMQVGKFVREVGHGMAECKFHHLPVSPLLKVILYTMDGQLVATHAFASSCFGHTAPTNVTKAVIKEVGSYCVTTAVTQGLIAFCISTNPGFWVVLGVGVMGAYAGWKYSKFIDIVWNMSSKHHAPIVPIYATPNIEGEEFLKSYKSHFNKVRTKRDHAGRFGGFWGDALPEEFFIGRPATDYNYVGITRDDFGFKWLIQLK